MPPGVQMVRDMSVDEVVTRCSGVTDLSDLWTLANAFFAVRGIRMVDYNTSERLAQGTAFAHIVQRGFPAAWVALYAQANLRRVDPIPETAARLQRPFLWSQTAKLHDLREDQKDFLRQRRTYVPGDGLVIPVYGPNMLNACVGLGFGGPAPELSARETFELQAVSQMGHLRYCEITRERRRKTELSPREKDVLRWIARGKSNSVIGEILGISRHTVDTMTRRMFEKLDVHDRTSAAVRGVGAGLIEDPANSD